MSYPAEYRYTKDHEWAKLNGGEVTVGITDHAQSALGDIVYVELPKEGRELKTHETFGVVESIKAVSDLYSPLAGVVTAVNTVLNDSPATVNQSPHTDGWLIRIRVSDVKSFDSLMDAKTYSDYVAKLK